jgi:hypothetical protein
VAEVELGPCRSCSKNAGEVIELKTGRFRFYVSCKACPFMTEPARTPGIAAKLWNDAKPKKGKSPRTRGD